MVIDRTMRQVRRRPCRKRWERALAAARGSEFLSEALGADLKNIFLAIKRQEYLRYAAEVTATDLQWYLHTT